MAKAGTHGGETWNDMAKVITHSAGNSTAAACSAGGSAKEEKAAMATADSHPHNLTMPLSTLACELCGRRDSLSSSHAHEPSLKLKRDGGS